MKSWLVMSPTFLSFWLWERKQENHTTFIFVLFLWIRCSSWYLEIFQYLVARRKIKVRLYLIVSQRWRPLMQLFARILLNLYLQCYINPSSSGILSVRATVQQFYVLDPICKSDLAYSCTCTFTHLPVLIQLEDSSQIYLSRDAFRDGIHSLRSNHEI